MEGFPRSLAYVAVDAIQTSRNGDVISCTTYKSTCVRWLSSTQVILIFPDIVVDIVVDIAGMKQRRFSMRANTCS